MAKDAKTVMAFLDDLEKKLKPVGEAERDKLLALKKKVHEKHGWAEDSDFNLWDYRYYDRLWTEQELALGEQRVKQQLTADDEKVKEYFPVSKVVPTILDIYKKLLSLEFYTIPKEQGGEAWHDEVQSYAVWDKPSGEFLGYMYLDLFPRENKYGHAAVWGLISGWTKDDGSRAYPVVCMVANLAKPTPKRPALMKHSDVVTFFVSLGCCMDLTPA